ncbi:hypothetical protein KM043_010155 [Ampulex compressa]|nr:hypothetical protein KM043_010155 [Ampulex compressa]
MCCGLVAVDVMCTTEALGILKLLSPSSGTVVTCAKINIGSQTPGRLSRSSRGRLSKDLPPPYRTNRGSDLVGETFKRSVYRALGFVTILIKLPVKGPRWNSGVDPAWPKGEVNET